MLQKLWRISGTLLFIIGLNATLMGLLKATLAYLLALESSETIRVTPKDVLLNIGIANSLHAELIGIIMAVEIVFDKKWHHLWIETDSKIATLAIKSPSIVPWKLKNRWNNCVGKLQSMQFILSHIYREENHRADKLANLGLSIADFTCGPFLQL